MSKPNFINHEIVFNPTGNEFDECRGELLGSYQLVKIEDYEYKFIKQPQLTIPKSIADLLDKFIEIDFDDVGHEDWWIQENGLIEWFSKTPNCYKKDAYLAGKALGVDLVKVVEG
ncbi:hypothetical protein [Lactococcus lactis]|uniref:hypothetical protein n=1 Tax=Lactococcus lactis TaxID=1358 RepID=UPI0032E4AF6B